MVATLRGSESHTAHNDSILSLRSRATLSMWVPVAVWWALRVCFHSLKRGKKKPNVSERTGMKKEDFREFEDGQGKPSAEVRGPDVRLCLLLLLRLP